MPLTTEEEGENNEGIEGGWGLQKWTADVLVYKDATTETFRNL